MSNSWISSDRKQVSGKAALSPYLFILLMTGIFRDIHKQYDTKLRSGMLEGDTMLAHDSMLALRNTKAANTLLQAIQDESGYYGIRLNKDKYSMIARNNETRV